MKYQVFCCLSIGFWATGHAQVLPFNEAGVTMGHHHIMAPDIDAQTAIWVDILGGELQGNPPLQFVKFPGTFLILSNGEAAAGTRGSALDHIAFDLRDLAGTRAKLAAAGVELFNESDARFDATLPGGIEVHFFSDPNLPTPIAHRAMAFVATDPDAQRAWWEDILGAKTAQEGAMTVSTIPGARLFFSGADTAPAPTRGRTLDHTGIGVADVGEFCDQLAAKGVECELLFGGVAAMITDPGGVTIEINSGLENR
ncbi:MAG: VOC family protein [Gammaproteobacteria bacterium]|jgi:catechol 2,3-dioxygenase-like lactoylglutathione lyase family enzyme